MGSPTPCLTSPRRRCFCITAAQKTKIPDGQRFQVIVHDVLPRVKSDIWWHPHGRRVHEGLLGIPDVLYATSVGRRLRGLWRLLGLLPRTFKVS